MEIIKKIKDCTKVLGVETLEISNIENEFASQLVKDKRKPLTVEQYIRNIRSYHKKLGVCTLDDLQRINKDDMKKYLDNETSHFSPSTVNNRIATLKVYYKFLMYNSYVKEDLIAYKDKIKVATPKYKFLESSEVDRLLTTANKLKEERGVQGIRDLLVIEIFLNGGLRAFELQNLKISDFDFRDGSVTFFGKGDIERTVYFSPKTLETLEEWLEHRRELNISKGHEDYLFLSNRGIKMSKRRIQQIVETYVTESDVTKVSTHKLRHTFATIMVGTGTCSDEELQGMLGHKHKSTTELYRHTLSEGLKKSRNMPHFA